MDGASAAQALSRPFGQETPENPRAMPSGPRLPRHPAAAQTGERAWHVTAYGSRWVNADLLQIPERSLRGALTAEDAYFVGAGLSRVVVPSFAIPLPGTSFAFRGNRIELEGQVLRHSATRATGRERFRSCSEPDRSPSSAA